MSSESPSAAEKEGRERFSAPPSKDLKPEMAEDSEHAPKPAPPAQEQEWVTGFKLLAIMTAVTLVALLMLLDTSIVVTVRKYNARYSGQIS